MSHVNFRVSLEPVLIGIGCIATGTIIASSVYAETKGQPVTCAPEEKPDAICSSPMLKGPDSKICFGDLHSRCFELKNNRLFQSFRGATLSGTPLEATQQAHVKASIQTYETWLKTEFAKLPTKISICTDVVRIESTSQRNEFCLSRLSKESLAAKTKELLATLENPTTAKK